jgi:ribosomal-protein-serine acetyltransferase
VSPRDTDDPLPIDLGDGVIVRRYTVDDLEALWAAADAERDRIGAWMPWVEETTSIEHQRGWLEKVIADPDTLDGTGMFEGDTFVGGIGLSWDPFRIAGEIGYWIRSGYEGRGLVTRAAGAYTRIAFDHVGLNRVVIRAAVGNARSRAVAERLGYAQEGVERGAGRGYGGFQDMVVYAMLADEWRARRR